MASSKDTFESATFGASTFAAGVFRGIGADAVVPVADPYRPAYPIPTADTRHPFQPDSESRNRIPADPSDERYRYVSPNVL